MQLTKREQTLDLLRISQQTLHERIKEPDPPISSILTLGQMLFISERQTRNAGNVVVLDLQCLNVAVAADSRAVLAPDL